MISLVDDRLLCLTGQVFQSERAANSLVRGRLVDATFRIDARVNTGHQAARRRETDTGRSGGIRHLHPREIDRRVIARCGVRTEDRGFGDAGRTLPVQNHEPVLEFFGVILERGLRNRIQRTRRRHDRNVRVRLQGGQSGIE